MENKKEKKSKPIGGIVGFLIPVPTIIIYCDIQMHAAHDIASLAICLNVITMIILSIVLIRVHTRKKKLSELFVVISFVVSIVLVVPSFFWINYACSDLESRHKEIVTVEKYDYDIRGSSYDMTVKFDDGKERTIFIGMYPDTLYDVGTTLPVIIENGLFGIDIVVKWGFDHLERPTLF